MARPVDLIYRFIGDTRSLEQAGRTASTGMDRMIGIAKKAAGALGALWAGREAAEWLGNMIQLGEQTTQLERSTEKLLGNALGPLRESLDDIRGVMGLNVNEMNEIITRLGLMTENAGLSNDAQADFIERLVTAAGEAAAFTGNIEEADDALQAMEAAIRGEFDPLERFGVKLKQAQINERTQEILAMNTGMSEQEAQVEAVAQLIEEQLAPAYGSLEDAANSGAGAINEATTALQDYEAATGQVISRNFNAFMRGLGVVLTDTGEAFRLLGHEALGQLPWIESYEERVVRLNEEFANMPENIKDVVLAQDEWRRLSMELNGQLEELRERAQERVEPNIDARKIIAAKREALELEAILGRLARGGTLDPRDQIRYLENTDPRLPR